MGLLGDGWDDPRSSAMMALAGGLLKGDFGGGLLGANDAYTNARKAAMDQKFRDVQMQNYQSEIEARKLKTIQDQRQQRLMESFFPGLLGEGAPSGASTMGAGPSGGMPQGGGMAPGGMPPAGPAQGGGGNDILRIAQQYGIPPQAIQADIVFNGGKKISELLDKHGSRDMQVTNGYAYDRNQLGAGFMPFLNTSQSGQTSMGRIGPDGLPVVSAPAGAMETYGAYRGMDESTRAKFDPLPITPAGSSNPVMRSRLSVMQEANGQPPIAPQPGMQGRFVGSPEAVAASIASIRDPQERANAQAAFEQQMRASGGRLPAPGGIAIQSEAEKLKQNRLAEAEATRETENTNKGNQFKDFRDQLGVARTLLQAGPTESGVGAAVDDVAGFFGKSLPGANIARALDTTSKWLSQNVPKAPGAQSDAELKEYQGAAGLVGDRRVPIAQRLAALDTVERLISTWEARRSGVPMQSGGATGSWDKPANLPRPMPGMVRNGYRFKGGDPASPSSWEKQ